MWPLVVGKIVHGSTLYPLTPFNSIYHVFKENNHDSYLFVFFICLNNLNNSIGVLAMQMELINTIQPYNSFLRPNEFVKQLLSISALNIHVEIYQHNFIHQKLTITHFNYCTK